MKRISVLIVLVLSSCTTEPVYQVGTLTKGNPDNSYLDSCNTYCCGD